MPIFDYRCGSRADDGHQQDLRHQDLRSGTRKARCRSCRTARTRKAGHRSRSSEAVAAAELHVEQADELLRFVQFCFR